MPNSYDTHVSRAPSQVANYLKTWPTVANTSKAELDCTEHVADCVNPTSLGEVSLSGHGSFQAPFPSLGWSVATPFTGFTSYPKVILMFIKLAHDFFLSTKNSSLPLKEESIHQYVAFRDTGYAFGHNEFQFCFCQSAVLPSFSTLVSRQTLGLTNGSLQSRLQTRPLHSDSK